MKDIKRLLIIELFIFALVNGLFFLLVGTDNTTAVWIEYGMINLQIILFSILINNSLKSKISFATLTIIILIGTFISELITAIVIFVVQPTSYILIIILNILGFFFQFLSKWSFVLNTARINKSLKQDEKDKEFFTKSSLFIQLSIDKSKSPEVTKHLMQISEMIKYSQLQSNAEAKEYEEKILKILSRISQEAGIEKDSQIISMIDDVKTYINARNIIVKN